MKAEGKSKELIQIHDLYFLTKSSSTGHGALVNDRNSQMPTRDSICYRQNH